MGIIKILFFENNNIKRLYLLINRESGIEIPQAKILTIKQQNSGPMREHHLTSGIMMTIEMHQKQRTNVLHIATRKRPRRLRKTSRIAVETPRSSSKVTPS